LYNYLSPPATETLQNIVEGLLQYHHFDKDITTFGIKFARVRLPPVALSVKNRFMSSLKYDEIAIYKPTSSASNYNSSPGVRARGNYITEFVKFNTDAFKHKQYPTCACGIKYVPLKGAKQCPYCRKKV